MAATPATNDKCATTGHLRGSVLLVIGRVLAIFVNFGVQILTVRYLDKSDYGVFAFALSIMTVASVVATFGMDKTASRYLSVYLENHDFQRFWGALYLLLGTVACLGGLVVGIFAVTWHTGWPLVSTSPKTQTVLAITAGLGLFDALSAVFLSLFAVLTRPAAIFVRRYILAPSFKLIAVAIVASFGGNVFVFAAAQLAASFLGTAVCVVLLIRILGQHEGLRKSWALRPCYPVRELLSYGAVLLSGDFAFLMRGSTVPIVLGMFFVGREVADYQAVAPLARLNEFVMTTFSVLFLPSAAKLAAGHRQGELQRLFEKTTVWVTLLSFPIFAVSFLCANQLPVLLFGDEYESSGRILAWLAVAFFINAAFGMSLRLLRAAGKLRTLLMADSLLAVVALIFVFTLVPRYGALGGAWAVCAAYGFQSMVYHALAWKTTGINPFTRQCMAPFFVGVGICVAIGWLGDLVDAGLAAISLAAILASLTILFAFGRDLDLSATFPEISKLPILRKWAPSSKIGGANLP